MKVEQWNCFLKRSHKKHSNSLCSRDVCASMCREEGLSLLNMFEAKDIFVLGRQKNACCLSCGKQVEFCSDLPRSRQYCEWGREAGLQGLEKFLVFWSLEPEVILMLAARLKWSMILKTWPKRYNLGKLKSCILLSLLPLDCYMTSAGGKWGPHGLLTSLKSYLQTRNNPENNSLVLQYSAPCWTQNYSWNLFPSPRIYIQYSY